MPGMGLEQVPAQAVDQQQAGRLRAIQAEAVAKALATKGGEDRLGQVGQARPGFTQQLRVVERHCHVSLRGQVRINRCSTGCAISAQKNARDRVHRLTKLTKRYIFSESLFPRTTMEFPHESGPLPWHPRRPDRCRYPGLTHPGTA
ncbi:hypothetical protein D9M73_216850 [compost metagenome]